MKNIYIICDYKERVSQDTSVPADQYRWTSIQDIIEALNNLGYNCLYFGGIKELIKAINTGIYDSDGIYLNFNDGLYSNSRRGQTPILLELMKVKYSGSSPLTHLMVSNKFFINNYLEDKINDLHIPKNILLKSKKDLKKLCLLNYPIILKPNCEGSSLGIDSKAICHNDNEATNQYMSIKKYGEILAQEFIGGYEITNYFIIDKKYNLLFNEVMMISKEESIVMDDMVFTYEDKIHHKRKYHNPYDYIDSSILFKVKEISHELAQELNIRTFGRIDYKIFNDKLFFLEANTIPAFSKTSDIGEMCKIYKLEYFEILQKFMESIDQ